MPRQKLWWKAGLASFGAKYTGGEVDGFHIAALADDGTPVGRMVDLELTDEEVGWLIRAMTEYLGRDRSKDAGPPKLEGDKT